MPLVNTAIPIQPMTIHQNPLTLHSLPPIPGIQLMRSDDINCAAVSSLVELEQLSSQIPSSVNFEQILYQTLVNDGEHIRLLNGRRPQFTYNEKQLRDAAAAEVAQIGTGSSEHNDSDKLIKRRKLLSADEKAQQDRNRNREHAKNTRLRKKAYVNKLKELVESLHLQKNIEVREKMILGERIYDTQVVRRNAVRLMLTYHAINVQERQKWAAILDESFFFSLPITPYRHFHQAEIVNTGRVLIGIDATISDAASLALVVESLGQGNQAWKESIKRREFCHLVYSCNKEDMIAAGDLIMCKYVMNIEGYQKVGCTTGCVQHGMLQCKFNKQNKIISAELTYDVMGFMQQLQRACNLTPASSIVPNTLSLALLPCDQKRIIINAQDTVNFPVVCMNEAFANFMGIDKLGAEKKTLIQVIGITREHMKKNGLQDVLDKACKCRAGSCIIGSNEGSELIYLKALPLSNDSNKITHILLVCF